jgi:hypothetical protein
MQPASTPRIVADQMLMADRILRGFATGAMPMHPAGYQELASWVTASFQSIDSAALRGLRNAAPPELREIVENVLHERQVVAWAADDLVGLSALSECLALLGRCRRRGDAPGASRR